MTEVTKTRARRKAERPAEILEAALTEFTKKGFAATRLEDVAALAGVTKGTIYFYFETKERVFEETIRYGSKAQVDALDAFLTTVEGSARARLHSLLIFFYKRVVEDDQARETLRLLIAEGSRFPELIDRHFDEFMRPIIERLSTVVRDGIEAGEFRDAPAAKYIEMIFSPALLLNLWQLIFGTRRQVDLDAFIDAHFDLLMHGLRTT